MNAIADYLFLRKEEIMSQRSCRILCVFLPVVFLVGFFLAPVAAKVPGDSQDLMVDLIKSADSPFSSISMMPVLDFDLFDQILDGIETRQARCFELWEKIFRSVHGEKTAWPVTAAYPNAYTFRDSERFWEADAQLKEFQDEFRSVAFALIGIINDFDERSVTTDAEKYKGLLERHSRLVRATTLGNYLLHWPGKHSLYLVPTMYFNYARTLSPASDFGDMWRHPYLPTVKVVLGEGTVESAASVMKQAVDLSEVLSLLKKAEEHLGKAEENRAMIVGFNKDKSYEDKTANGKAKQEISLRCSLPIFKRTIQPAALRYGIELAQALGYRNQAAALARGTCLLAREQSLINIFAKVDTRLGKRDSWRPVIRRRNGLDRWFNVPVMPLDKRRFRLGNDQDSLPITMADEHSLTPSQLLTLVEEILDGEEERLSCVVRTIPFVMGLTSKDVEQLLRLFDQDARRDRVKKLAEEHLAR